MMTCLIILGAKTIPWFIENRGLKIRDLSTFMCMLQMVSKIILCQKWDSNPRRENPTAT